MRTRVYVLMNNLKTLTLIMFVWERFVCADYTGCALRILNKSCANVLYQNV